MLLLVASALLSVVFCALYVRVAMRLRDVQRTMAFQQAYRASFLAVLKDTIDYSEKNPAITPILESAGFKRTNTPAGAPH